MQNEFISRADIRRVEKSIEEETIRLGQKDGESVLAWAQRLEAQGALLAFKPANDTPPNGSNLDSDVFVLIIQTKYMREKWEEWGDDFAGLDATHNTSHYDGMSLFTLMCRDRWGHGRLLSVLYFLL